jgi:hypothetical protein
MCTQDPLYRAAAPVVHSELCPSTRMVKCKNGRLHPSVALIRHVAYCMRPSSSCTPRHLVTPCIPAYVYQDWFLVLHLANLDAQKE